jgi:hypothetical protein
MESGRRGTADGPFRPLARMFAKRDQLPRVRPESQLGLLLSGATPRVLNGGMRKMMPYSGIYMTGARGARSKVKNFGHPFLLEEAHLAVVRTRWAGPCCGRRDDRQPRLGRTARADQPLACPAPHGLPALGRSADLISGTIRLIGLQPGDQELKAYLLIASWPSSGSRGGDSTTGRRRPAR